MESCISLLRTPLNAIFGCCLDRIRGQIVYVTKLEENLHAFQVALQKLKQQEADVLLKVQLAQQKLLKPLNRVQGWLSRATTMIAEAENLLKDGPEERDKLCLGGYCSKNCIASVKYGKKVATMLAEINDHFNEGAFETVAEPEPAAVVEVRPLEPPTGQESIFDEVWSSICDRNTGIIGLYGLGGVGKTTLLTRIYNSFSTTPVAVDTVIWVVVSKDHSVERVQEGIGGKIGFSDESWKNRPVDQKASSIFRVLRQKKFVLLMDDLWERVDLTKVGIPLPSPKNGSKVVFTTRFENICGEMEARKQIKLEWLNPELAWKLFQEKVGEETLNHPRIQELAKKVAQQCSGLPLALITVGRAMSCKDKPEDWEDALEKLRRSSLPKMEKEVYPLLKFSYDSLPDDTMRNCFLYCCLYPEDHTIYKESLVEYWFCEGLLNDYDKVSQARVQGYSIINDLCRSCLLESDEEGFVKMHDVIRDMALWIASEHDVEGEKFFAKAGVGLTEAPEVRKWEGVRRMSLMKNQFSVLGEETPTCPNLQTLFLNVNGRLKVIGVRFFQNMPNLRVLNLSFNWSLTELPQGISGLVSLEYLNLSLTSIRELPIELKSLENLKILSLNNMLKLSRIPRHLISSFSKLQIFKMTGVNYGWDSEEDNVLTRGSTGLLVEELKCLKHLDVLGIEVFSASDLQSVCFQGFEGCVEALTIKNFNDSKVLNILCLANMKRLEILKFDECRNTEIRLEKIQKSVSSTRSFSFQMLTDVRIWGCHKVRDITWLILAPNLRSLYVRHCLGMEDIMKEEKLSEVADLVGNLDPFNIFAKLQTLTLDILPELKSIYWDTLPFPCLKQISVKKCPKVKKLPLNCESVKGNQIRIKGEEEWWAAVEWDDEPTKNVFLPSFIPFT